MSLFKKTFPEIDWPPKSDKSFIAGHIYKVNVASRSHVTKPYYCEVISYDGHTLITNIPDQHRFTIEKDTFEWDYHTPRFEHIGDKETYGHLIYNQKFE